MKKRAKAFLIFNVLFFSFDVFLVVTYFKLSNAVRIYEDHVMGREARQVIHEFINKSRDSNKNFSFDVRKEYVKYDPNIISHPYEIIDIDHYAFQWMFAVNFQDGNTYRAEVWGIREKKQWWLMQFELIEPRREEKGTF